MHIQQHAVIMNTRLNYYLNYYIKSMLACMLEADIIVLLYYHLRFNKKILCTKEDWA